VYEYCPHNLKLLAPPLVGKLVENSLRGFGHVERRHVDTAVRRVDQMEESRVKRFIGQL